MKIFDIKDIRDIDAYTIMHEPVSSIDLMERAASGCTEWIARNIPATSPVVVFTGPGNNGGDGWAIARLLADKGFDNLLLVHLRISKIISHDSEINRERLISQGKVPVKYVEKEDDFPKLESTDLIIDALFGSGLTRSLEGLSLQLVRYINESGCRVISIDVPSGLFGEDNTNNPAQGIVAASDTLTFEFPKRSFFFSENEKFTGNWHVIPIGLHAGIIKEKQTYYNYTGIDLIKPKLKKRRIFAHKGLQGHALLIAGSYGMMGAAILSAKACLRTGTGLLTTHLPGAGYPIVQMAVPESVYSIDRDEKNFSRCPSLENYSAIAAGPGLGTSDDTVSALESLLRNCRKPLLLDADALNTIATHRDLIELLPENTILTPHPGEFDRIAGTSTGGYMRNKLQIEFSRLHKIIIVLKGAYTSITMPDGRCYYNSTGNPGMATAGSGDVLTGMILSLLAQGYMPEDAALTGAFIHGMAGDLAASKQSELSMIASDIIEHIGLAFIKILKHEESVI